MNRNEALVEIEELLATVEEAGEELKRLFEENFKELYEKGEAYGVFNLIGSHNKYETTLEQLYIEAAGYEECQ